ASQQWLQRRIGALSGVGLWAEFGSMISPKAWDVMAAYAGSDHTSLVSAPSLCPTHILPAKAHHAALDPTRNAARRACDGRVVRVDGSTALADRSRCFDWDRKSPAKRTQRSPGRKSCGMHCRDCTRDACAGSPNLRQLCWF